MESTGIDRQGPDQAGLSPRMCCLPISACALLIALCCEQKKASDASVSCQFVQVSSVQKPATSSSNKNEHVDGHEQCIVGDQEYRLGLFNDSAVVALLELGTGCTFEKWFE
jgi:hypothetical protein